MHVFGSIVNCGHMNGINQLFESVYCIKKNELQECINSKVETE